MTATPASLIDEITFEGLGTSDSTAFDSMVLLERKRGYKVPLEKIPYLVRFLSYTQYRRLLVLDTKYGICHERALGTPIHRIHRRGHGNIIVLCSTSFIRRPCILRSRYRSMTSWTSCSASRYRTIPRHVGISWMCCNNIPASRGTENRAFTLPYAWENFCSRKLVEPVCSFPTDLSITNRKHMAINQACPLRSSTPAFCFRLVCS